MGRTLTIEGPKLVAYQRAILDSPARFTITKACTKSGKTYSHAWWLFNKGHFPVDPGDRYQWIAPTYAQSAMVYDDIARKVHATKAYRCKENPMQIETPAGGVLEFLTGEKPNNLYGPSNVRAIVGDEFTRWRQEVWPVVRSLSTAKHCPVKLIGNYISDLNWGNRLAIEHANDPEWASFKITAMDAVRAGIMKAEEVESARRSLPLSVFMALYMCEGSADPAQLFNSDAILDLWTNLHVRTGIKALTCDVAFMGSDLMVIMAWDGWRVVEVIAMEKSLPQEIISRILATCTKWGIPRSNVVVDSDGIGSGIAHSLPGCVPFVANEPAVRINGKAQNFKNVKAQCAYLASVMVNDREAAILVDTNKSLVTEDLGSFKRGDMDNDVKLQLEPKEEQKLLLGGRSPDHGDAFIMRARLDLRGSSSFAEQFAMRAQGQRQDEFKEAVRLRFGIAPRDDDDDD